MKFQQSDYTGKVLLVVNVASACGLTPQYAGLQKIYDKYKEKGFSVLAFPANEFGAQEPGTNAEIKQFCDTKFGITFPIFDKVVVKGEGQDPLFKTLTASKPEAFKKPDSNLIAKLTEHGLYNSKPPEITWNFEKFLIGRDGKVIERFSPDIVPEDELITKAIESALAR